MSLSPEDKADVARRLAAGEDVTLTLTTDEAELTTGPAGETTKQESFTTTGSQDLGGHPHTHDHQEVRSYVGADGNVHVDPADVLAELQQMQPLLVELALERVARRYFQSEADRLLDILGIYTREHHGE